MTTINLSILVQRNACFELQNKRASGCLVAVDFLVYRTDELEKRLSMGDPFLKGIIKEGKVLYG